MQNPSFLNLHSPLQAAFSNYNRWNKWYFHQYMISKNTGSTWAQPPDITIKEIHTFLALIIQMGHDQHGSPKDYWSRKEQYCTPSYSSAITCNHFFHILRFLHFKNNANFPKRDDQDNRLFYGITNRCHNVQWSFISLQVHSTCFGRHTRPSSGVQS